MFNEQSLIEKPIIQRSVLRESVKKYITDLILSGTLPPGDRIVETKIAKTLKVSQSPVREALRDLELIGLIETRPFQGAIVKKLTRKGVAEAYQVRSMMEGVAAREAAIKITDNDISLLKQLLNEIIKAADSKEKLLHIEKDIAFHEAIFKIAGNELLYKMWKNVCLSSFTFLGTNLSKRGLPELAKRHEDILNALSTGDADLAEKTAKSHIDELAKEIIVEFTE